MTHQPHQTIPSFTGKIQGGLGETKQESRIRSDLYAASRYAKRVAIDRILEQRKLEKELNQ